MKINLPLLITILFLLTPVKTIIPQEIEATLGGSTSNYGFSIKNINNTTLFRVLGDGKVGICTTNPSKNLDVNGTIGWGTSGAFLSADHGASIELRGQGNPYIDLTSDLSDYNVRLGLTPYKTLNIEGNGVGIGTENTKGYKLAVAGNIIAEEIVVKLLQNWPDFVFTENFARPTLKELNNFVIEHKHLPDIPDAEKIGKEGINIGELGTKLLKKIEELTLYLIEQDKKIDSLKNDYELLKKGLEQIYKK
jgi:hypothetical protein